MLMQDPDIPAQAGDDVGNITQLHPVGAAALGLLVALLLLLPRRFASLPLIMLLCFIPAAQRVVVAGVDFTFVRLLLAAAWGRLIIRGELRAMLWNHMDRVMVLWAAVSIVTGTLLGMTLTLFINRTGAALDAMMTYFLFRQLIRTPDDLTRIAMQFVACGLAVAVFFVIENRTSQNMFYVFGGVGRFTDVRNGRLRCQGAFAHSILAGCFWASLIPFYFVRGWLGRGWLLSLAGIGSALLIVALTASSTPIMAVLFGVVGGAAFWVRGSLRWWRWLIFAWLCVLHFVLMKAPVWNLLARVDIVSGSTGWHRYHLVDRCIANFNEWWLFGTLNTGHWGPGLHDVTNQYVAEGVSGGVARLCLFVTVVVLAFMGVSRSMRMPGQTRAYRFTAWALGTALFMHCMNFLGVSYFEQIVTEWHMTLAMIASLTLVPGARVAAQLQTAGAPAPIATLGLASAPGPR